MIDVEVHNFQSIEHVSIRIDGFTALVGKSDIGKSAIVRAVRAALTGATGTAFVRHGVACLRRLRGSKTCECHCIVHIRTEGFDLKWEKGDKRNSYTFNGQDYGVPNRGTPDFLERPKLAKDFGMVKVGDNSKLLQIADQFDNIFLLDQSGSVVADVFSDVAHLDRINVAMRLVEKDRKEAVSTRKVREKDMTELTHQLNEYEDLDTAVAGVVQVEKKLGQITAVQGAVESLDEYIDDLQTLGFRVDALRKACETPVPVIDPLLVKKETFESASRFQAELVDRATAVKALMGVETISVPTLTPIVEAANKYQQLSTWVAKLQGLQEQWAKFKGVEGVMVPDPAPLKAARDNVTKLSSFADGLDSLYEKIEELNCQYDAIEDEEGVLREEAKAFPFCPSCAQPVKIGHKHEERELA